MTSSDHGILGLGRRFSVWREKNVCSREYNLLGEEAPGQDGGASEEITDEDCLNQVASMWPACFVRERRRSGGAGAEGKKRIRN